MTIIMMASNNDSYHHDIDNNVNQNVDSNKYRK